MKQKSKEYETEVDENEKQDVIEGELTRDLLKELNVKMVDGKNLWKVLQIQITGTLIRIRFGWGRRREERTGQENNRRKKVNVTKME